MCGICGKLNSKFLCNKCGILLKKQAIFFIQENLSNQYNFSELYSVFSYEGIIRKAILQYKFQEKSYIYNTFVNFLLKNEKIRTKIKSYDIIIPVPISKKRYKKRGYNQSALIAKSLAKYIKIQYEDKCLKKVKEIIEQSKLDKKERIENIKNAYEVKNGEILIGRKILLIDDIYTTGSTVNECSRVLKQYKPEKIGVFTLAKD